MKQRVQKVLGGAIAALVMAGCGSSSGVVTVAPQQNGQLSDQQLVDQATVADPELALRIMPREHLDPLSVGGVNRQGTSGPQTISVEDLETDYEVLFGGLSQALGVTETTPQVVADIEFIASQPDAGYFDLSQKPILNNPLGVTGASFQTLNYATTVPLPTGEQTFQVSGGVLLPEGIDKTKLQGLVVYFHGTTFNKSQAGSDFQDVGVQLCAQVFVSQGYAVVIPDYVGQGIDWQNVHPYVIYPEVSARTAVDMVTAVKPVLIEKFALSDDDPPMKLFSTGYSEGGAYALWFNTYLRDNSELQDPFYTLTHSVGLEGAYAVSSVVYDYLFENISTDNGNPFQVQSRTLVNVVKPALGADAFLAYATYSVASDYAQVFNPDFFAMEATDPVRPADVAVNGQSLSIAQAFALQNTTIASQLVLSGLGKSANGSKYPGLPEMLTSSKNSVKSLVDANLLSGQGQASLQSTLQAATLDLSRVPDDSVSMVTLDMDSVVVPNNYDEMVQLYPTKIKHAVKIDHTQLNSLSVFSSQLGRAVWTHPDHPQGQVFAFLYALKIFNEY